MGIHFLKYKWLQPKVTRRTLAASTSATHGGSCSSCNSPCHSTASGPSSVNTTPSGSGGEAGNSSHHTSRHGTVSSDQQSVVRPSMDRSSQDKSHSTTRSSTTTELINSVLTSIEYHEGHFTRRFKLNPLKITKGLTLIIYYLKSRI